MRKNEETKEYSKNLEFKFFNNLWACFFCKSWTISGSFVKVNLIYSKELTELEIQNRIEQIPKTTGIVRENERIMNLRTK